MKASENEYPKITIAESAAPGTPTADLGYIYEGTDKKLYLVDDTGAATDLTAGGDAIAETLIDARGDVVVGTAADTAAILSIGTDDYVLTADSTAPLGLKWAAAAGVTEILDLPTAEDDDSLVLAPDGAGGVEFRAEAGGGGGGPAGKFPVQTATQNGSSNTNSLGLTLGATPTEGNILILVAARDNSGTISSITQTGVTWTLLKKASAAPMVEVWKGVVGSGASASMTVAYSNESYSQYVVSEWSGLAGTLDQSADISGSTSYWSHAMTPILLPTDANALVIGGCTTNSNGSAYLKAFYGGLIPLACQYAMQMRMLAGYAFPGTTPIFGETVQTNGDTTSGVLVSIV